MNGIIWENLLALLLQYYPYLLGLIACLYILIWFARRNYCPVCKKRTIQTLIEKKLVDSAEGYQTVDRRDRISLGDKHGSISRMEQIKVKRLKFLNTYKCNVFMSILHAYDNQTLDSF